jgi:hypothetical protein
LIVSFSSRELCSFGRFLDLGLEDAVPDAKTLWLYRETLAKAGEVEELFDLFDGFVKDKGYLAMGGLIIDATIVSARILRLGRLRLRGPCRAKDEFRLAGTVQNLRRLARLRPGSAPMGAIAASPGPARRTPA